MAHFRLEPMLPITSRSQGGESAGMKPEQLCGFPLPSSDQQISVTVCQITATQSDQLSRILDVCITIQPAEGRLRGPLGCNLCVRFLSFTAQAERRDRGALLSPLIAGVEAIMALFACSAPTSAPASRPRTEGSSIHRIFSPGVDPSDTRDGATCDVWFA